MKRSFDFLLIIMSNLIGFLSVSICFFTLMTLGIVREDFFVNQTQISFESWSTGILIVWIICFLFSLAGLFMKQKQRLVLMISPAFVPIIYGFSVLVLLGGASF